MVYRSDIDGLRALAVLPVILFHSGVSLFSGGFVGVDVFFVISGYLITLIILEELRQNRFSVMNFYERRARRILPALTFVVLFTFPLIWGTLTPDDMKRYSQSLVGVATFTSNILFWLQIGYFDPSSELKPLLHTWSLAVEEQYYILIPIILMLLWRFGMRAISTSFIAIFVASLLAAHFLVVDHPSASFFLIHTRAWELLLGSGCSIYTFKKMGEANRWWDNLLSAAGLLLILYAVFFFNEHTLTPSFYTLIPTVGTGLVLLFSKPSTLAAQVLSLKPMVGIGLISYSAYLWHQPLLAILKYRLGDAFGLSASLFTLALVLVLSFVSWKFVEQPFRDKGRVSRTTAFSFSGAALSIFMILGLLGHMSFIKPHSQGLADTYDSWPATRDFDSVDTSAVVSPQFVLFGDSHAIQYFGSLRDRFGEGALIAKPGCLSLPNLSNLPALGVDPDCFQMYEDLVKYVVDHKVKRVYWAQSWDKNLLNPKTQTVLGPIVDNAALFSTSVDQFIARLPQGTELVIFSHVPSLQNLGGDMRNGYLRCRILVNGTCPESFQQDQRSQIETNQILAEFASRHQDVKYYDLGESLCKRGECFVLYNDNLIYSDNAHLTRYGTALVINGIKNE